MVMMLLIQGCKYWTIKLPRDDKFELPKVNERDPDITLTFDNVYFNDSTQPENNGLKILSFKIEKRHHHSSCGLNWSE